MVRLSRAAAVKDGPFLGPPGGLVLDGRERDSRLVCVETGATSRVQPLGHRGVNDLIRHVRPSNRFILNTNPNPSLDHH
jgi:hypothetical protein